MLGTFFPMPPILTAGAADRLTARAADRTGDTSSKARLSVQIYADTHALLNFAVF